MNANRSLTWNELADDYDSCHSGSKARALPMGDVFRWAEKQEKRYKVEKDGTIHYKGKERRKNDKRKNAKTVEKGSLSM